MTQEKAAPFFTADQQPRWRNNQPGICGFERADLDSLPTFVHPDERYGTSRDGWKAIICMISAGPSSSSMICDLPEYLSHRTENAILGNLRGDHRKCAGSLHLPSSGATVQ